MTTREPVRRGRHFLVRDGQPYVPVGAHLVPSSGPDWPWRVGIEELDRELAAMAAAGLDTVRVDLVWAALEGTVEGAALPELPMDGLVLRPVPVDVPPAELL